jgi:hypothetical protein
VVAVSVHHSGDPEQDDCLRITLDRPGDFSVYRVCLVEAGDSDTPLKGIDPRFACLDFSFKVNCPSDLDCQPVDACVPEVKVPPEINYLAKDYGTFRQLILDRLALIMPDWRERHVPDVGITLVELLAYAGDYLSYYQDAVATEAYLDTARQRISVRRHARLVDYRLHEGVNARAWVTVETATDLDPLPANSFYFITGFPELPAASGRIVKQDDLQYLPRSAYEVFEPLVQPPDRPLTFYAAHSRMRFYTWGDGECCLAKGATRATLWDEGPREEPPPQSDPGYPPANTDPYVTPNADPYATSKPAPYPPPKPDPYPPPKPNTYSAPKPTGSDAAAQPKRYRHEEPPYPPPTPDPYPPPKPSIYSAPKSAGADPSARPKRYRHEEPPYPPPTPYPPPELPRLLHLTPGDVLIFEEVLGPVTGNPADADPARRHAVRLTRVTPLVDRLLDDHLVLDIEWAPEDALPFSLCLSARLPAPDCRRIDDVSIARGNVVLVDHGRTERGDLGPVESTDTYGPCTCEGALVEWTTAPVRFRPELASAPLTFAEGAPADTLPASLAIAQDVRRALPSVSLTEYPQADETDGTDGTDGTAQTGETQATGWRWDAREDLLASDGESRHFVAETDDDGRAHLRFGDGELGRMPAGGTRFQATSRIGNGPAGNVGREAITHLVMRQGLLSADAVLPTNPLPARGGTAPEPIAEAKLLAPHAFRERLERAITAEDYATLAGRTPGVQRAAGELRWTGSWYEARVAVDPAYTTDPAPAILDAVAAALHRYRRMGHDLAVTQAHYAPLDVSLEICLCARAHRAQVKAALLDVFSNRLLRGGGRGLFHPDAASFGDGVYLSRLVAAAKGVAGVETVRVVRCHRLETPAGDELDTGILTLGPMEIARLDNDPNFPEHGALELTLRGGR